MDVWVGVEDGVNVKVGVNVDVGVEVMEGVNVKVGVKVRVHAAAVTVSAANVLLTCSSREGPHPVNTKQMEINRKQKDFKWRNISMCFLGRFVVLADINNK